MPQYVITASVEALGRDIDAQVKRYGEPQSRRLNALHVNSLVREIRLLSVGLVDARL
jgi:hypothetical protein